MHAVFVQTSEQQAEHVPRWLEPVDPATCRLEAARQAGNQRRLLEAEPEGVGEATAIRGHGEGGRSILVPRQHLGPGSDGVLGGPDRFRVQLGIAQGNGLLLRTIQVAQRRIGRGGGPKLTRKLVRLGVALAMPKSGKNLLPCTWVANTTPPRSTYAYKVSRSAGVSCVLSRMPPIKTSGRRVATATSDVARNGIPRRSRQSRSATCSWSPTRREPTSTTATPHSGPGALAPVTASHSAPHASNRLTSTPASLQGWRPGPRSPGRAKPTPPHTGPASFRAAIPVRRSAGRRLPLAAVRGLQRSAAHAATVPCGDRRTRRPAFPRTKRWGARATACGGSHGRRTCRLPGLHRWPVHRRGDTRWRHRACWRSSDRPRRAPAPPCVVRRRPTETARPTRRNRAPCSDQRHRAARSPG